MLEEWLYLLSQMWQHRQNRFIAVGGLAVFFVGLMFVLVRLQGVPESILAIVAFLCGVFCLGTIALMIYYPLKFIGIGVIRLYRLWLASPQQSAPDVAKKDHLG
jgi:hypothetical protein